MFRVLQSSTLSLMVLIVLASPGALLASTPADAQAERSVTVHFADLNLNEPADVAVLYQRIRSAAAQVCGPRELGGPHIASTDYHHCVTAAIERTVTQVDRPGLGAYHRAHGAPSNRGRTVAQR